MSVRVRGIVGLMCVVYLPEFLLCPSSSPHWQTAVVWDAQAYSSNVLLTKAAQTNLQCNTGKDKQNVMFWSLTCDNTFSCLCHELSPKALPLWVQTHTLYNQHYLHWTYTGKEGYLSIQSPNDVRDCSGKLLNDKHKQNHTQAQARAHTHSHVFHNTVFF